MNKIKELQDEIKSLDDFLGKLEAECQRQREGEGGDLRTLISWIIKKREKPSDY